MYNIMLLRGERPPLTCQGEMTVEHILLHCVSFTNTRDDFLLRYCNCRLNDIFFSKVAVLSIIDIKI